LAVHYIQFPLPLLAYHADVYQRLVSIISYGAVEAGVALLRKLSDTEVRETAKAAAQRFNVRVQRSNDRQVAAVLGCDLIWIKPGSVAGMVQQRHDAEGFLNAFKAKHGGQPLVRVRKDFVFDARDHKLSYREFATYAALLSCIGSKQYPVRVTREQIQARMLGYKTSAVMRAALPERADGATPLTIRQVGYTLDQLHERGFFVRARANERQTFYSIRHKQEAMEAAVFRSKTYRHTFHRKRRERDKSLIERIKAERRNKADAVIEVDRPAASPELSPNGVQSASGAESASCPITVHFNKNPSNKNPSNKIPGTETHQEKPASEGALALAKAVASKLRTSSKPRDMDALRTLLKHAFKGGERWAEATREALERGADCNGQPIQDWRAYALAYANKCELSRLRVGETSGASDTAG
jgi:hypothetical protein